MNKMSKLVRFNCNTAFRNIPDSKFNIEVKRLDEMADEDIKKFGETLAYQRTKFALVDVKKNQEVMIPDWYYENHKDYVVSLPVSFDKYRDRRGNRIPFSTEEALKHGDISDINETMKVVKKFELIEKKVEKVDNGK